MTQARAQIRGEEVQPPNVDDVARAGQDMVHNELTLGTVLTKAKLDAATAFGGTHDRGAEIDRHFSDDPVPEPPAASRAKRFAHDVETPLRRTSKRGRAPCSIRSAALSSADWPAPMTATSRPTNFLKSM